MNNEISQIIQCLFVSVKRLVPVSSLQRCVNWREYLENSNMCCKPITFCVIGVASQSCFHWNCEECCKPIRTWGRCCKPIKMQFRVKQRQQNGGYQFRDRGTVTGREQIKMATILLDSLRKFLSNYDSSYEEKVIKTNEIKEKCMSKIYQQQGRRLATRFFHCLFIL